MKPLAGLLEAVGHGGLALRTGNVLLLHGYQYHGPDPGGELSKYAAREDAAADIAAVAQEAARHVESLKGSIKRGGGLERALEEVRSLGPLNMLLLSPSSPLRSDARRGGCLGLGVAAGAPSLSARRRRLEAGGLSIGATGLPACIKAAGSRGERMRRIPPTPWRRRRRPRRALGF